jgi:hypothetical protein
LTFHVHASDLLLCDHVGLAHHLECKLTGALVVALRQDDLAALPDAEDLQQPEISDLGAGQQLGSPELWQVALARGPL